MKDKMKFTNTKKAVKNVLDQYGTSVLAIVAIFIGIILALTIAGSIVLGILWCIWQLWMFVIPQIFTTAPEGFKYPGYLLFVSSVILFNWLRILVFGIRNAGKDKNAS